MKQSYASVCSDVSWQCQARRRTRAVPFVIATHAERLPAKRGRDGTQEAGVPTAREQRVFITKRLSASRVGQSMHHIF